MTKAFGVVLGMVFALAALLYVNLKGPPPKVQYLGTGPGSAPRGPLPATPQPAKPTKPIKPVDGKVGPWQGKQIINASIIIEVGRSVGMPCRAWIVAVGTALQESRLTNLGHLGDRNDHDSLGLFQQRPSQGWGTRKQVTDPVYASRKFYHKLSQVRGWEKKRLTDAAQRVQISGFPEAYQKHRTHAIGIVHLVLQKNKMSTAGCPTLANPQGL